MAAILPEPGCTREVQSRAVPSSAPTAGAEAQRARLLDAVVHVVAERGYAAATVADVVRRAGVSRSTFYELFASKEACFLDGYRAGVDGLAQAVRDAVREARAAGDGGWRAELRAGVGAYLRALEGDPALARTYCLEIHAAGPAALDARTEALRGFAERYARTARRAGLRAPHPESLLVLTAGTEQLVAERVRAGRTGFGELEDVFCECAEAVLTRGDRSGWT
jgi:AcrR family transcriptional regulator